MVRTGGQQVLAIDGVEGVLPASLTTVYSDSFELENVVKIGYMLTAASDGDVDVLVKLQVSEDGTTFAIQDGYSDLINITDESAHNKTIYDSAIPAGKYARLSFTGQNTNHATCAITGYLNLIRDERD